MAIGRILISNKGIGLSEDSFVFDNESETTVLLSILEKDLKLFDWVGGLDLVNSSVGELVMLIRNKVLLEIVVYSEGTQMDLLEFENIPIRTAINSSSIFDLSFRTDLDLNRDFVIVGISDDEFGAWSRDSDVVEFSDFAKLDVLPLYLSVSSLVSGGQNSLNFSLIFSKRRQLTDHLLRVGIVFVMLIKVVLDDLLQLGVNVLRSGVVANLSDLNRIDLVGNILNTLLLGSNVAFQEDSQLSNDCLDLVIVALKLISTLSGFDLVV